MFLRKWNSTTSNLLARESFPPAAKLAQLRYGLPSIYSRASTSSYNGLSESKEAVRADDTPRLTIIKVPNNLVLRFTTSEASNSSSHKSTSFGTEQNENASRSLDIYRDDSILQTVQARKSIVVKSRDNGSSDSDVVQDPPFLSEERQYWSLQGRLGEEAGFEEPLNKNPTRLCPSTSPWTRGRSWEPPKQVQGSNVTELGSTGNADWAHLSPSRPLFADLWERFQQPLNTQQIWKLQELVNYYKTRSALTREFGEKSEFSYDWTRPLEILQSETQLKDLRQPIPFDAASFIHYHFGESREMPNTASEMQLPTQWTRLSFAAFVTRLTRIRPSSWDKRRNRRHRSLSVEEIDACLMSLFNDPNLREYLTVDAFNSALAFFYTHKHHSIHRVRELYNLMESLQMDTDPRTFVIMLAAAARQKNLALLSYVLAVMVRKNVRPTRNVWLKLLETVQAKSARLHIIKVMRTYGLLEDIAVVRSVVGLTIPLELPHHIQSGQDLQSFCDFVDAKYGIEWSTPEIGNQMTKELCRSGLFSDALQIWPILQARGCLPDTHTEDIFLRYSKRLFDVGTSIEIVQHFWRLYGIKPSPLAHDLLFRHAWAMRSYNCCKIVWQHACMMGYSHSKLDSMLLFSLTRRKEPEPNLVLRSGFKSVVKKLFNPSDAWFKGAGKVILDIHRQMFLSALEALKGQREAEGLPSAEVSWEDRWKQDMALHFLKNREEELAGKQFQDDFVDLVVAAYELDRVWHDQGCWENSTEWKVANAITIPVESRQTTAPLDEACDKVEVASNSHEISVPIKDKDQDAPLQWMAVRPEVQGPMLRRKRRREQKSIHERRSGFMLMTNRLCASLRSRKHLAHSRRCRSRGFTIIFAIQRSTPFRKVNRNKRRIWRRWRRVYTSLKSRRSTSMRSRGKVSNNQQTEAQCYRKLVTGSSCESSSAEDFLVIDDEKSIYPDGSKLTWSRCVCQYKSGKNGLPNTSSTVADIMIEGNSKSAWTNQRESLNEAETLTSNLAPTPKSLDGIVPGVQITKSCVTRKQQRNYSTAGPRTYPGRKDAIPSMATSRDPQRKQLIRKHYARDKITAEAGEIKSKETRSRGVLHELKQKQTTRHRYVSNTTTAETQGIQTQESPSIITRRYSFQRPVFRKHHALDARSAEAQKIKTEDTASRAIQHVPLQRECISERNASDTTTVDASDTGPPKMPWKAMRRIPLLNQAYRSDGAWATSLAEVRDINGAPEHKEPFYFRRCRALLQRPASAARASRIFLNKRKNIVHATVRKFPSRGANEVVRTEECAHHSGVSSIDNPLEKSSVRRVLTKVENEAREMVRRRAWRYRVQRQRWAEYATATPIHRLQSGTRKEKIATEASRHTTWRHIHRHWQRAATFRTTKNDLLKMDESQQPSAHRETNPRNPFRDLGLRWQRKFAARRKLQAAAKLQAEFSRWLEKMTPGETSGFKPLRESTETLSSFKEIKTRAAVRELQELDLSQAETAVSGHGSSRDRPLGTK